jgi:hypothetical protein
MLAGGARLAASRRFGDMAILKAQPLDQWWQLTFPDAESGWIHKKLADGVFNSETRRQTWDQRFIKVVQEWETAPNAAFYKSGTSQQEGDSDFATAFTQIVTQTPATLSITLTAATGVRLEHKLRPPPQFVGAGRFADVLASAPATPIVLRSDRAPLIDAPQLSPVSILINAPAPPDANGATAPKPAAADPAASNQPDPPSPAQSAPNPTSPNPSAPDSSLPEASTPPPPGATAIKADAGPLRVLTAEVNGSGEISRWCYRADGTLDHIDAAGGLRVLRSDELEIGALFKDEPMLKPGS